MSEQQQQSQSLLPFKVGIIGGTGFTNPALWGNDRRERKYSMPATPFGNPSDNIIEGRIAGVDCLFLARHGGGHQYNPTNVPYRANIWALWEAGARMIFATAACGSLLEEVQPGQMVLLDSFFDRTTRREQSFYSGDIHSFPNSELMGKELIQGVCHIPMCPAFSGRLRRAIWEAMSDIDMQEQGHQKGIMVCIEGPRFSTVAESLVYRDCYKAQLVGMTVCPEAVLARELGIPYAIVGLVTDWDCWRGEGTEVVEQNAVMQAMVQLGVDVTKLFQATLKRIAQDPNGFLTEIDKWQRVAQEAVMPPARPISSDWDWRSELLIRLKNNKNGDNCFLVN